MFSLEIVERTRASKNKYRVVFIDVIAQGGAALALARSFGLHAVLADFPKEKENNVC